MTASASTDANTPALTLYGKMLTFTRIKLTTADLEKISTQLELTLGNKTSKIPVVIDSDIEQDLPALVDLFWSWGLQPIGVVTGVLDEAAKAQKLAIFPSDGKRIERIIPAKQAIQTKPVDQLQNDDTLVQEQANAEPIIGADRVTSMIYDQMVRSGQSINHVGGDLILTNSVNDGAEVITDNSLHVYGRAQGRLVAGATGDKDARIFCQRFNPSLVSVAGTYCLHDSIPTEMLDKPVQVSFKEEVGLVFEIMSNT